MAGDLAVEHPARQIPRVRSGGLRLDRERRPMELGLLVTREMDVQCVAMYRIERK